MMTLPRRQTIVARMMLAEPADIGRAAPRDRHDLHTERSTPAGTNVAQGCVLRPREHGLTSVNGQCGGIRMARYGLRARSASAPKIGNGAIFRSGSRCDRLPLRQRAREAGAPSRVRAVKSTRTCKVGRTLTSRCLVALVTAGLVSGLGVSNPGPAAATDAARHAISVIDRDPSAIIALPVQTSNGAADPSAQTDTETLDA